jgi:hypothetical protein
VLDGVLVGQPVQRTDEHQAPVVARPAVRPERLQVDPVVHHGGGQVRVDSQHRVALERGHRRRPVDPAEDVLLEPPPLGRLDAGVDPPQRIGLLRRQPLPDAVLDVVGAHDARRPVPAPHVLDVRRPLADDGVVAPGGGQGFHPLGEQPVAMVGDGKGIAGEEIHQQSPVEPRAGLGRQLDIHRMDAHTGSRQGARGVVGGPAEGQIVHGMATGQPSDQRVAPDPLAGVQRVGKLLVEKEETHADSLTRFTG